jgi:porphobilinogen synthase
MTDARFPQTRLRRLRQEGWARRLVSENHLSVDDLIWPIFVREGQGEVEDVATMPGVQRVTIDRLAGHVEGAVKLGIPAIAIDQSQEPHLLGRPAAQARVFRGWSGWGCGARSLYGSRP